MKDILDEHMLNENPLDDDNLDETILDELPFSLKHGSSEQALGSEILRPTKPSSLAYEYLEEGHIRLLRLLPGDSSDEIRCKTYAVEIERSPVYTALSYTWGSSTADCRIYLNGVQFFVTKNLRRFLHHAREIEDNPSRLFWIDALCIDQSNDVERTRQVRLMPQIYATAELVRVWLGPSYDNSGIAMQALGRRSSLLRTKKDHSKLWSSRVGAAIRGLCARAYWTRLWVFQELMLARSIEVMCGNDFISWTCQVDFLSKVYDEEVPVRVQGKFDYEGTLHSPAMSISEQTRRPLSETNLFDLLVATQRLACTEIRDRVYGLLGLAVQGVKGIQADYNMPIPMLLNAILRNTHNIKQPGSIKEVQRECETLTSMFRLHDTAIFTLMSDQRQSDCRKTTVFENRLDEQLPINTLKWTTFYGHTAVTNLLFDEGIVKDATLHHVLNPGDSTAVKLLLDTGRIDVNWVYHGQNALQYAASVGNQRVVELLLNTGKMDLGLVDISGRTALGHSAYGGHVGTVKLLLDAGAAEVDRSRSGSGPLHLAAGQGHDEILKLLLDTRRFDVNDRDKNGITPLHSAAMSGNESEMRLFLESGVADLHIIDADGCGIGCFAGLNRDKGVLTMLQKHLKQLPVDGGEEHEAEHTIPLPCDDCMRRRGSKKVRLGAQHRSRA